MTEQVSRLSIVVDLKNADKKLTELRKTLSGIDGVSAGVGNGLDDVSDSTKRVGTEAGKTSGILGKLSGTLGVAKKLSVGFGLLGAGVGVLAAKVIPVQREFDVLNAQLVTATGSADNANEAFNELKKFAAETPYDLQQSVSGFAQLKNLGLDPSIDSLRSFGNTASAMGKDLSQMIEAVADASTNEFERLKEFGIKAKQEKDKVTFTFQGVETTVAKNSQAIQQYLIDIGNTNFAGAMTQRMDTLDGALSNLGDSYHNLLLTISQSGIGDVIKENVLKVVDMLGSLSAYLQKPETVELFRSALAGVGEAFGLIQSAMASVIDIITPIASFFAEHSELSVALGTGLAVATGALVAFNVVIAIATGVTTAFGIAIAVLTSPITLVVAAIAGLVAIGVYLYRNWDTVKAKAKEVFDALPKPVQQAIKTIKDIFNGIVDFVSRAIELLAPIVKTQFELQVNNIKTSFAFIKGIISTAWQAIKAIFTTHLTVIATVFNTGFALIKNTVSTVFNAIKALLKGDFKGFVSIIGSGIKNSISIVAHGVRTIADAFVSLGSKLWQLGKDAIAGFIKGIKDKFTNAVATAKELAGSVASTIRNFFNIHSPSRLMAEYGAYISQGLAVGIKTKSDEAVAAAKQLSKAVADEIADLKKQLALFADDSPMAQLMYELNQGKFALADSGLKDQLIALRSQLDLLTEQKQVREAYKTLQNNLLSDEAKQTNELQKQLDLIAKAKQQGEAGTGETTQQAIKQFASPFALNPVQAQGALGEVQKIQSEKDRLESEYQAYVEHFEKLKTNKENHLAIMAALDANYRAKKAELDEEQKQAELNLQLERLENAQNLFGNLAGITKTFAGENSKAYRVMFAIEKGFAIARSIIAIQQGIAQAAANPFPLNIAAMASVAASTASIISTIQSVRQPAITGQAHDGIDNISRAGTWYLDGGERIVKPSDNKKLTQFLDKQNTNTNPIHVEIHNYAPVKVATHQDDNGNLIVTITEQINKQVPPLVGGQLANPSSTIGKGLKNNWQTLPRR